ncbi:MAG: hypothetical protein GW779_05400 [Candidatus Altiarchaeum hamiconexum]|uniref:Uncharacterized protein n=1 Tax=Candidatus Altarchaeum hamiconexum TaxID=1803513 RepID=A0A8J7YT50_9ARCH|nr:hypothetical protein [Candidatus Altarchaeum hamiconexum]PIV28269.1 MAG: hypothetical protein COS36_02760 [Candidatus Altarchaeum sp. CG03_land_8_20_14_0_80_32_618]PIX49480.1 MAG: hypothetical protein COZ53_00485 [Candidatus Altarchaeum sp. CG_4_8_14_3_um_filter_33_2054]NCN68149.1 hypothetical protein [Candidatus Altarchaeum hamiconexum]NCS91821.1 hypothetical protein [Candidatus Altarchaeum hamiconexum]
MVSANSAIKGEKKTVIIDEEILEKETKELGEHAEKEYRYNAFWRPVVGGLLFGLGGSIVVMAAVFGWTYHLLGQGYLTMFFGMLIGFTMLYIGIGLTS